MEGWTLCESLSPGANAVYLNRKATLVNLTDALAPACVNKC